MNAVVAWSAIFGLISLVTAVEVLVAYLRGPVNSGDVPESLADVLLWILLLAPYLNALALPVTAPLAVFVGALAAWFRSRAVSPRPTTRAEGLPRAGRP